MPATVAVVGGGYAGIAAAKALDDITHVVLVEPRDVFVHNVAALRGLVDPEWTDRMFLPYDGLLERGRVLRDRAVRVDRSGVTLDGGERIDADYIVLATGSAYPFPAKTDVADSATAKATILRTREALAGAGRALLLGAGPVGLELAGEIKAVWPRKAVTIIDPAGDILSGGYTAEFRTEVRRQLDMLGVELVLGTSLHEEPPSAVGNLATFTTTTRSGKEIAADIWFRCYGILPVTDYLDGDLSPARQASGHLAVTDQLRLLGQETVFAIGDLTAIREDKKAKAAEEHANVVVRNIRTLVQGGGELASYRPSPPAIVLPLGPDGGASYAPHAGVLDAVTTVRLKSADLRLGTYLEVLGLERACSA